MRATPMSIPAVTARVLRGEDHAIRKSVASAAASAEEFAQPGWRFVVNSRERAVFAVAPGLYPDLVALDGSETGVAWILDVATPASLASEAFWDRWTALSATGLSFILAVPYGCRRLARKVAETLGLGVGLIYEYGVTPGGVVFPARRREAPDPAA